MSNIYKREDIFLADLEKKEKKFDEFELNAYWKPMLNELLKAKVEDISFFKIYFHDETFEELQKRHLEMQGGKKNEKERMDVDLLTCIECNTSLGDLYLVAPSGHFAFPLEWIIEIEGKVPYPVIYSNFNTRRSDEGSWSAIPESINTNDHFLLKLKNFTITQNNKQRSLDKFFDWEKRVGLYDYMKIKWIIQIFPISMTHYIIQMKRDPAYDKNLFIKDLRAQENLEVINLFIEFIKDYNFQDQPLLTDPIMTKSLSVLPNLRGKFSFSPVPIDKNAQSNFHDSESLSENLDPITQAKQRLASGEISTREYKKIIKLIKK